MSKAPKAKPRVLTPKQRVLKEWPEAYCNVSRGGIAVIYPSPIHGYSNAVVSSDKGAKDAWAQAEKML